MQDRHIFFDSTSPATFLPPSPPPSSLSFISPVARAPAPRCLVPLLLLVALAARPSACNPEDAEDADKEPTDAPSAQLSVTGQVTPTPLWAVDWGPTQQLEDETYHFLSSQETDALRPQVTGTEDWLYGDSSLQPAQEEDGRSLNREGAEEEEVVEEEDQGTGAEETEPEEGGHQGDPSV